MSGSTVTELIYFDKILRLASSGSEKNLKLFILILFIDKIVQFINTLRSKNVIVLIEKLYGQNHDENINIPTLQFLGLQRSNHFSNKYTVLTNLGTINNTQLENFYF